MGCVASPAAVSTSHSSSQCPVVTFHVPNMPCCCSGAANNSLGHLTADPKTGCNREQISQRAQSRCATCCPAARNTATGWLEALVQHLPPSQHRTGRAPCPYSRVECFTTRSGQTCRLRSHPMQCVIKPACKEHACIHSLKPASPQSLRCAGYTPSQNRSALIASSRVKCRRNNAHHGPCSLLT